VDNTGGGPWRQPVVDRLASSVGPLPRPVAAL